MCDPLTQQLFHVQGPSTRAGRGDELQQLKGALGGLVGEQGRLDGARRRALNRIGVDRERPELRGRPCGRLQRVDGLHHSAQHAAQPCYSWMLSTIGPRNSGWLAPRCGEAESAERGRQATVKRVVRCWWLQLILNALRVGV
jgi:hypothetical protein